MTAVSAKKVEGFVEELNPTTILVSKKTIYLPPNKREEITALNLIVGESVRIIYDMKGNLISAERIDKDRIPPKFVPAKVIDADTEQAKKLHIHQSTDGDKIPQSGIEKKPDVYIQQQVKPDVPIVTVTPPPSATPVNPPLVPNEPKQWSLFPNEPKQWISEREKNNSIILESVLARSVEIVNSQYRDSPEIDYKGVSFQEILDTKCNHIENVADRLFAYVKKKVDDEQRKSN